MNAYKMTTMAASNDALNNQIEKEQFATRVEQSSQSDYAEMDFERKREL
jgi:hypothetical protein